MNKIEIPGTRLIFFRHNVFHYTADLFLRKEIKYNEIKTLKTKEVAQRAKKLTEN